MQDDVNAVTLGFFSFVDVVRNAGDSLAEVPRWWIACGIVCLLAGVTLLTAIVLPRQMTRLSRWFQAVIGPLVLVVGFLLILASLTTALEPKTHSQTGGDPVPAAASPPKPPSWPSALYTAAQFFFLNADPSDYEDDSRWAPSAVAILAPTLFVLVAIQAIALLFRESLSRLQLFFIRNHVVVCGVGRIGHQIIHDLVVSGKDGRSLVAIENDPNHVDIPWLREHGVHVISGSAQRGEVLDEARIHRASEVFVVTGSDELNVECVAEIRDRLNSRRRWYQLKCHVHLRDRDLANAIRARLDREDHEANVDVEIFNATERTVLRLLQELVSRPGRVPECRDEVAHVVIIGFGEFGQSLAVHLAIVCHFANLKRLRMTIIDHGIEEKAKAFLARYPRFTSRVRHADQDPRVAPAMWNPAAVASDDPGRDEWESGSSPGIGHVCNVDFLDLAGVDEETLVAGLDRRFCQKGVKPLVFICFDADRMNFKFAVRLRELRDRIIHAQGESPQWPIFVWIPAQRELADVVEKASAEASGSGGTHGANDPIPFGSCYGAVSYQEVTASWVEEVARFLKFGYTARYADPADHEGVRAEWAACAETVKGLPFTERHETPTPLFCFPWTRRSWVGHVDAANRCWNKERREAFRASDRSSAIHAVVKLAYLGYRIDPANAIGGDHRLQQLVCVAKNQKKGIPVIGDHSLPDSGGNAISDADEERLRCLPKMEHYRWCAERLMTGWQHAPVPPGADAVKAAETALANAKQAKKKRRVRAIAKAEAEAAAAKPRVAGQMAKLKRQFRHADIVPFDQLSAGEQQKDNFSVQIVLAMAASDQGLLRVSPINGCKQRT